MLWIHKSYFVVQKLVWNVPFKSFDFPNFIICFSYYDLSPHLPCLNVILFFRCEENNLSMFWRKKVTLPTIPRSFRLIYIFKKNFFWPRYQITITFIWPLNMIFCFFFNYLKNLNVFVLFVIFLIEIMFFCNLQL